MTSHETKASGLRNGQASGLRSGPVRGLGETIMADLQALAKTLGKRVPYAVGHAVGHVVGYLSYVALPDAADKWHIQLMQRDWTHVTLDKHDEPWMLRITRHWQRSEESRLQRDHLIRNIFGRMRELTFDECPRLVESADVQGFFSGLDLFIRTVNMTQRTPIAMDTLVNWAHVLHVRLNAWNIRAPIDSASETGLLALARVGKDEESAQHWEESVHIKITPPVLLVKDTETCHFRISSDDQQTVIVAVHDDRRSSAQSMLELVFPGPLVTEFARMPDEKHEIGGTLFIHSSGTQRPAYAVAALAEPERTVGRETAVEFESKGLYSYHSHPGTADTILTPPSAEDLFLQYEAAGKTDKVVFILAKEGIYSCEWLGADTPRTLSVDLLHSTTGRLIQQFNRGTDFDVPGFITVWSREMRKMAGIDIHLHPWPPTYHPKGHARAPFYWMPTA
jgi:hypothetical protein